MASLSSARAEEPAVEQPEIALDVDREIDIANIVTSAAKGVTTVQEAPAIVTIITAEEIRQRGWRTIGQALGSVPGWMDVEGVGNQVTIPMVRGTIQAALYLRDGVSFFDPVFNVATLSRAVPLETIKRIEVVTGPGGVLWGANSYLGIVNVITKDADDVGGHGFEASVGGGDGPGSRQDFRGYAMFGRSFWKNRLRILLHASAETFIGPEYSNVPFYAASPAPQPAGPAIYGLSTVTSGPARSWLVNLDAKVSLGPVTLYLNFPIGELNHSVGFGSTLILRDTVPGTMNTLPNGDRTTWNFYDRYGVLEYKDRFFRDRFGLNAKAYYIQFNRDLAIRLYPSSGALPTGFSFKVPDLLVQRFGGTLDLDFSGPWSWNRILAGVEAFHERTSTGHIDVFYPDAAQLPLQCPLEPDLTTYTRGCPLVFVGGAERTVLGVFLADQIRPLPVLTFDGGVRYQQGFGQRGYAPQFLGSAAAVWQFLPDAHVKLNWAQGFRPPVFNNTDGNGAAVQFAGNPRLLVERSQSFQGEVNARLLKGVKKIRELQLRADYAYTVLDNFITIRNSVYTNAGKRAIHSVEFLSKLYLQGDHALTLGYTFLRVSSIDLGQLRNVPNHWFQVGAVFNVVKDLLDVNANLNVFGAYEDADRFRSTPFVTPAGEPATMARYTDLGFDQLTPVAQLQLGVRGRFWKDRIQASVQAFNVLNQRWYYPDVFYDQAPTIEMRPNPAPGFSFFASLTLRP